MSSYLFTSESVSEGHPDKVADQISDAVLDAILAQDRAARVACETMVKTGVAIVGGEITTNAWVDIEALARKVINEIGYTDSNVGFDGHTCGVLNLIGKQSPDIAQGVDRKKPEDQGAGDQGLMFGFACRETAELMPAPIHYAHRLVEQQAKVRKAGKLKWLRPDAKSQVTLRYDDQKIATLDAVVLSTQHDPEIKHKDLIEAVREHILKPVLPKAWLDKLPAGKVHINPTGKFVIGGPVGATIVCDDAKKLAARLEMNRGGNETALTPTAARAVVAQCTAGRERGAAAGAERKVESLKSMIEVAHQREGVSTESARTQCNPVSREWGMSR